MISLKFEDFNDEYMNKMIKILFFNGILLILFRFFTLFDSTSSMHEIVLYDQNKIILVFSIISLIIIFYLSKSAPLLKGQDLISFLFLLLFEIFLVINISEIYLQVSDVLINYTEIGLTVIATLLSFYVILSIYSEKINDNLDIYLLSLFVLGFLLLILLFKLMIQFFTLIVGWFIFLANIFAWLMLWIVTVIYFKKLYQIRRYFAIGVFIFGLLLGFGMGIGMSRSELTRTIALTIFNQAFNLSVNEIFTLQILNFNITSEFIMILGNALTVFPFTLVMISCFYYLIDERLNLIILFTLCGTGMGVTSYLVFIRGYTQLFLIKLFLLKNHSPTKSEIEIDFP
ncbi:MAG: hypothetical protein ACXAC7_17440 [Candidatus Hodarchaeales archaeon]|jgi:hypothetical protein